MKKHLFITGPAGIGKTELIRRELKDSLQYCGGIITENALDGMGNIIGVDLLPAAAAAIPGLDSRRYITYAPDGISKDNEAFREYGVQLLSESAYYPLTMLDELGGPEMVIPQFRKALEDVLNNDSPVIGVLMSPEKSAGLQRAFGLGDRYTDICANLHSVLRSDPDTVVLDMASADDPVITRIVRQWVREFGVVSFT